MTGFFIVDRRTIDLDGLKPRGFKILLEILARKSLRVAEVPFRFADRFAGESKASVRQGVHFLVQLTGLRFGKMSLFAIIGGLGAVANLIIMWALTKLGMHYIPAAVIAAELTIVGNFVLQERFVFQDMRGEASGVWSRFAKSFAFNNAEAVVRIPMIALLVNTWHLSSVIAAAITLALAFVVRFMFHSLVVYAPRKAGAPSVAREIVDELDAQAIAPGEL
ncbi:GtrA family protein [Microbacterium elymi]|uniref:GtrA family protein n=1 Tax=Microbacterium elymi TaxID=2909587 RepID=UPI00338EF0F9